MKKVFLLLISIATSYSTNFPAGTKAVIPLTVNHTKVGEDATHFCYQVDIPLPTDNAFTRNFSDVSNITIFDTTTGLQRPSRIIKRADAAIGTNWNSRFSAADNNWRSIVYGNGLFVAVGASGTGNRVMTSPDGITWTSRVSAVDNVWMGVAFGNGLFVAVSYDGTGNRVMTSPDGITWTSRVSASNNNWRSVTYGNGLFVAVSSTGTGNRVMTSPDGITWTSRVSASDNNWFSVTFGNNLFVAVAATGTGNRVMTSPDGITWTSRVSASDNGWAGVTFGNNLFVAVAYSGTVQRVMTSPDGITWTLRSTSSSNDFYGVSFGDNLFVAVSTSGIGNRVMTSPDGITWTNRSSPSPDLDWMAVTYGNGLFAAVAVTGAGNRVMTSTPHEDLFCYFDGPTSTTTDKVFFACAGKTINRTNSSATFTNSNITNYWGLGDSASPVIDYADSKNGTVTGATLGAVGQFNGCASFTGGSNRIQFTTIPALSFVNKFTYSQLVKWSDFSTTRQTFTNSTNVDSLFYVYTDATNHHFSLSNGAGFHGDGVFPVSELLTNMWYLITVTYDGTQSTNADKVKVYVNGTQKTLTFTGTFPATTFSVSNPYIGSISTTSHSGSVDESLISSDVYTAGRVTSRSNMLMDAANFWTQGAALAVGTTTFSKWDAYRSAFKKAFKGAFK